MNDLISRQQAIGALRNYLVGKNVPCDGTLTCRLIENEVINKLPSATDTNVGTKLGTDCISRQAAINKILGQPPEPHYPSWYAEQIKELPSAQLDTYWKEQCQSYEQTINKLRESLSAQPKRGKWILDRSGAYCCSECMEPCASYVMMKPRDKFCKMCGSRNEVTT